MRGCRWSHRLRWRHGHRLDRVGGGARSKYAVLKLSSPTTGQSMGASRAMATLKKAGFSASLISPMNSYPVSQEVDECALRNIRDRSSRRPDCMAGHVGLELGNACASH